MSPSLTVMMQPINISQKDVNEQRVYDKKIAKLSMTSAMKHVASKKESRAWTKLDLMIAAILFFKGWRGK